MAKWVCPICEKEFQTVDAFITHYETGHLWPAQWSKNEKKIKELTKREFYCQFCGKTFKDWDSFKKHIITEHKYDSYKEIGQKYGFEGLNLPAVVMTKERVEKEEEARKEVEKYPIVVVTNDDKVIGANTEIEAVKEIMKVYGAANLSPGEFKMAMIPVLEQDLGRKLNPKISYKEFLKLLEEAGYIKEVRFKSEEEVKE